MSKETIWYRDKGGLNLGGVARYIITYKKSSFKSGTDNESLTDLTNDESIFVRLKNIEKSSIRAIHLLNGPFILYCHIIPCNYDHKKKFTPDNPIDSNEVVFKNDLKPGQTINVELFCNANSLFKKDQDLEYYQWTVDIISQIVVSRSVITRYDFLIGSNLKDLKKVNHGPLNGATKSPSTLLGSIMGSTSNKSQIDTTSTHSGYSSSKNLSSVSLTQGVNSMPLKQSTNPQLSVEIYSGDDLWNNAPNDKTKPIHLIIVTHGIFSNIQADMLYLKETIEQNAKSNNVLVRGFTGNSGKSEKGIKKLGKAVGNYIVHTVEELSKCYTIDKISFIGHSLGGVVQLFGLKYLLSIHGEDYFERQNITPEHLVSLASPFLGVLSEMSFFISWFLDIGALGKTGRDLTLSKKIPTFRDLKINKSDHNKDTFRPILETLPDEPLHSFLEKFKHLTLYANSVNDGIVPLRTSSLLYLDWEALGKVGGIQKSEKGTNDQKYQDTDDQKLDDDIETIENKGKDEHSIGEVPPDAADNSFDDESNYKERKGEGGGGGRGNEHHESISDDENKSSKQSLKKKTSKSSLNPLKLFNKKGHSRREMKFIMASAKGKDAHEIINETSDNEDDDNDSNRSIIDDNNNKVGSTESESRGIAEIELNLPPKASAFESALNTIIFPVPNGKYILDPHERNEVIFHDKYYRLKDMDKKAKLSKRSKLEEFLFKPQDHRIAKQVKIAKKYHVQLTWRKVLVHLPPDAHNNIVVRRRFSNGYGWGVIDHLARLFEDQKLVSKI